MDNVGIITLVTKIINYRKDEDIETNEGAIKNAIKLFLKRSSIKIKAIEKQSKTIK